VRRGRQTDGAAAKQAPRAARQCKLRRRTRLLVEGAQVPFGWPGVRVRNSSDCCGVLDAPVMRGGLCACSGAAHLCAQLSQAARAGNRRRGGAPL
jgi:hypothetical protein